MGTRAVAIFVLATLLVIGGAFGWASQPAALEMPVRPVPTFAEEKPTSDPDVGKATERDTLLPTDCAVLLAGPVDASALLGQPVNSFTAHSIVGVGSPSVGLLERLTCNYRRSGQGTAVLAIELSAFTDPVAAAQQRDRNMGVEHEDTRSSRNVPLGRARATLLSQPDRYLLMAVYDRYTVTVRLARGVIPDDQVEAVLVDLARRVWTEAALPISPTPPPPSRR